jgi:hypothetical protein
VEVQVEVWVEVQVEVWVEVQVEAARVEAVWVEEAV